MAGLSMKIRLDMDDVERVVQVHCMMMDCPHNTRNCSHGQSAGFCNLKHVCIGKDGRCTPYVIGKAVGKA